MTLYSSNADEFARAFANRQVYLNQIDRKVQSYLFSRAKQRVLDVGGGDGKRSLGFVGINGSSVTVVEPSELAYQIPRANGFEVVRNSFEAAHLEGKFDLVLFLWSTLGHFSDWKEALSKSWRLLNSGGMVLFDVNNFLNFREYGYRNFLRNLKGLRQDTLPFTARLGKRRSEINLFNPLMGRELRRMFPDAQIKIRFLDYGSGRSASWATGQIYVQLAKVIV